jgi:phosphoribosylformylglycinamidine synthase
MTRSTEKEDMKAKIYVTLKASVLDPQGKAIQHALDSIGFKGIKEVRQGKYFEVAIDAGVSTEEAMREIDRIAKDVLSNPVIEDYRIEFEGATKPSE